MIRFTVPAIPIAQPRQRHRVMTVNGRPMAMNYTPAKHPVQDFKASVRMAFAAAYSGPPLEGPVKLVAVFVLPRPKRLIWKSRPMPRVLHIAKPDLDNLEKALKDSLNGLAWRDDSQVCDVEKMKFVAAGDEQPGVTVEIGPA